MAAYFFIHIKRFPEEKVKLGSFLLLLVKLSVFVEFDVTVWQADLILHNRWINTLQRVFPSLTVNVEG
jgi:hypothetical protein